MRRVNRAGGLLGLVLACGLATSACAAPTLSVRAPVLIPARVPVRAYPNIWLVGGETASEVYLLDRLAVHLAADKQREVRRLESYELEPARASGQIEPQTAVVTLSTFSEDKDTESVQNVPVHWCGYYGCGTDWQLQTVTGVEVAIHVKLTVADGPSGRVLQTETISQRLLGQDRHELYREAVERLGGELERAVDVLRVRPRFALYKVKAPSAAKLALDKVQAGDWEAARAELEQASKQLSGQKKETQAKVLFNLGIARWLAPGPEGLTQQAYEAAQRAFIKSREAQALPEIEHALEELAEARERFRILSEQRKATEHNFKQARERREAAKAQAGSDEEPASSEAPSDEAPGASESAEPQPAAPEAEAPSPEPGSATPAKSEPPR